MKYVISKNNEVIIFSDSIRHSAMISREEVKSAGFIKLNGHKKKLECYGDSHTLDAASRPKEDELLINLLFTIEDKKDRTR